MKKLFIKCFLYAVLVLCALEVYVRLFHLTKDYPSRYVDEYGVEKWVPNQSGFSVTGNRRQNFSEFNINSSGFNSYREYNPSKDRMELALVGDSFIEGFHQHYYNSIGKKIENRVAGIDVYEFGYAGYDFADQLHLVHSYQKEFNLIDYVVLGLKFENDLTRAEYEVVEDRMRLETPLFKALRNIKVLGYAQSIGIIDPIRKAPNTILRFLKGTAAKKQIDNAAKKIKDTKNNERYFENFKNLIKIYNYDKERFILLLDKDTTPKFFIEYLNKNNFKYINFTDALNASQKPTTLIYDRHWNNNGRNIIAQLIADYINTVH